MTTYKTIFSLLGMAATCATPVLSETSSFLKRLAPVSEGSFKVGVFYDNVDRGTATLGLDQEKLFGTDEHLKIDLTASSNRSAFSISSTDSDIFESPWSRTFSFTSQQFQENPSILRDFQYFSTNSQVSFARPIDDTKSISLALGHDLLDFGRTKYLPLSVANSALLHGNRVTTTYTAITGRYSTMIGTIFPTAGSEITTGLELGKADQTGYAIARASFQHIQPIGDRFFARVKLSTSAGKADGTEYPFNKNLMAGGAGTVRGYKFNSLGPQSTLQTSGAAVAVGGKYAVSTSIEAGAFLGANRDFAAFIFLDAGNAGNTRNEILPKNLEKSQGLGLRWMSPIGPLDISYAQAINPSNPALTEKLQLSFGRVF